MWGYLSKDFPAEGVLIIWKEINVIKIAEGGVVFEGIRYS